MSQNIIAEIAAAVKGGANLEDVIPLGADITLWQKLVNNYNPNPKPKRSRNGNGKATRRSQYARMQSALSAATLKLVERANQKKEIPFNGAPVPYDSEADDYGLEPAL